MTTSRPGQVAVFGTGNVASHIAEGLTAAGAKVTVISHADADRILAGETPLPEADTYIISVTDAAITGMISGIADNGALWVHTAGSVGMELFEGERKRYGILYPLQTFTVGTPVDMAAVPWLIEAVDADTLSEVRQLASLFGDNIHEADSELRAKAHLAAVFASNFICRMLAESERILDGSTLPFDILRPLVNEVTRKAFAIGPHASQTGPARRGDMQVIHRQLSALPGHSAEIYRVVTAAILNDYHPESLSS
ncbi:MAG: DUF2520 domain-containing protein [bacterium]|nr:DUF2520 domain-containing protein [bacterium]